MRGSISYPSRTRENLEADSPPRHRKTDEPRAEVRGQIAKVNQIRTSAI
jgi:hypothetical protein